MKNKQLVVIGIIVFAILFWWLQIRPSSIRKECYKLSWDGARKAWKEQNPSRVNEDKAEQSVVDRYYELCLRSKGLK